MRGVLLIPLLVLLGLLPGRAHAQVMRLGSSRLSVDKVVWGFDPENQGMPAECYAPVTVTVSSGGESVQGVLILEYPQDASQNVRIVAPFATTPNTSTAVELLACLPRNCQKARLTLTDDSGDSARLELASMVGDHSLPIVSSTACRIGLLGGVEVQPSVTLAVDARIWQNSSGPGTGVTARWWDSAVAQKVPVLPDAWIEYESFDVVVAREHDILQATAAAREALHTWVQAGGRLVIQASQAGQRTFEAVPPDVAGYLTIDDPLELTPGASTKEAFSESRPTPTTRGDDSAPSGPFMPSPPPVGAPTSPKPAALVEAERRPVATIDPARTPVRLLHLTAAGKRAGWIVRFPVADLPAGADSDCGLVAHGPSGLGLVAVVGMNPKRVCGIDVSAHDSLWRTILSPLIPHWNRSPGSPGAYPWGTSGVDQATSAAIAGALNSITMPPTVGSSFFIASLAAVLALGLLIGPVGRVVLKRRRWLSASWLAAIACIAVVSVAGWLIPNLVRSGESAAARLSAVDALCDEDGSLSRAWSTSITSFFAGRPGFVALPGSEDIKHAPTGGWWRGVSTVYAYSPAWSRQPALSLVTVPGGAGQRKGTLVQPVEFGQWTYRAFLDQQSTAPDSIARVTLSLALKDEQYVLTVRGLPEGCEVGQAALMLDGQQVELGPSGGPEGLKPAGGVLRLMGSGPHSRERLDDFTPQETGWDAAGQYGAVNRLVAENAALPLQRGRNAAIETRVAQGGACVRMKLSNVPLDWDSARWHPATTRHEVLLRAVLPASSVRGVRPAARGDTPDGQSDKLQEATP